MQLIRFVAVACMVAVSVASLGCGGDEKKKDPPKKDPPADTGSMDNSSKAASIAKTAKPATEGVTEVSFKITKMT